MILTRTPFRMSFAGGGSDLPGFFEKTEGAVLSTAINKSIYLSAHPYFEPEKIHLKYSKNELVDQVDSIQHPIFKSILKEMGLSGIELSSIADIPSGTGLGSSSSFTVGLHLLLNAYQSRFVSKYELARRACETEIEKLKEPIGKQDQYAAAFGGLNLIRFLPDGEVIVEPVLMNRETRHALESNLLLFYTGDTRAAKSILQTQKTNTSEAGTPRFQALQTMVKQAHEMKTALECGKIDAMGEILHEGWALKKTLAGGISNERIDVFYEKGRQAGALGGKLLGAGGGGFLLFYVRPSEQMKLRQALSELRELPFRFEQKGSEVIFYES